MKAKPKDHQIHCIEFSDMLERIKPIQQDEFKIASFTIRVVTESGTSLTYSFDRNRLMKKPAAQPSSRPD